MHCLVVGRTNSGKSWLVKKLANKYKHKGYKIIVLDPFMSKEWGADFITNDQNSFLKSVWNSKNCIVIVDEAGQMIGRYNETMERLATQGRHFGHKCYFITQRAKQVALNVRSQCSECVVFKQSYDDTKDLANEFVDPNLNLAHELQKFEFLYHKDDNKNARKFDVREI